MVNSHGLLENDDVESQALEDDQSQVDLFTPYPGGRRDTLRRAFGREVSSCDEHNQGDTLSRRSERVK